ncbi:MAG: hypothetical protein DRI73_03090 [Bacteroidetes bacterium]|nr:MAG: hypothetical protein DRI73_03090 [Bacteroidota bacterium]
MLIIFVAKNMKIAIPTNDKESVFPRTGQAHGYMIYHVEDNHIKGKFYKVLPAGLRQKHENQDESKEHSHRDLCQFLEGCDLLLIKNIGKHLQHDFDENRVFFEKTKETLVEGAIKKYLEEKSQDS